MKRIPWWTMPLPMRRVMSRRKADRASPPDQKNEVRAKKIEAETEIRTAQVNLEAKQRQVQTRACPLVLPLLLLLQHLR